MEADKIDRAFLQFLADTAVDRDAFPAMAFRAMIQFYREQRADGCHVEDDGDMLLFQWGILDWGDGEHVEVDITRQLMLPDDDGDEALWQLHLTYRRPVQEADRTLEPGSEWCETPDEADDFEEFVASSPAFALLDPAEPGAKVEIGFECAG